MKRIMTIAFAALLTAGCATTSSVKEEMKPLADKVTALEQKQAATDAKLADLTKTHAADVAALRKDIGNYNAAAQKAAADAEAAAVRAETAAAKAAKAFELKQGKGK